MITTNYVSYYDIKSYFIITFLFTADINSLNEKFIMTYAAWNVKITLRNDNL